MQGSSVRQTLLSACVGGLGAATVAVPYYLLLRAYFRANPPAPQFRSVETEHAIVTLLSILTAICLGALVPVILRRLRLLWVRLPTTLPFLLFAFVLGPLPIYWYVYRDAPPGLHINIPILYRFASLTGAACSLLVSLLVLHFPGSFLRRRSIDGEA